MAVPLPPGGTLQVVHFGEFAGTEWKIIHHFAVEPGTAPTQADLDGVTEGIRSAFAGAFLPLLSDQLVYEGATSLFWDDDGDEFTGTALNAVIGSLSGGYEPASVCVLISWRVGGHWKGGHPRSYFSGIHDGQMQSADSWTSDTVSDWQSAAASYLSDIAAVAVGAMSVTSMVVLRRFADGGSETDPPTYLDPPEVPAIVGALARARIASQRRRMSR